MSLKEKKQRKQKRYISRVLGVKLLQTHPWRHVSNTGNITALRRVNVLVQWALQWLIKKNKMLCTVSLDRYKNSHSFG